MSYVYVLTNEAMPGYVKIGMTERPVKDRVLELDNTSVPLPFQCYYAARVEDHKKVERALHTAFGNSRIRTTREFFSVDAFRVKAILDVIALEDVTPREEILENKDDASALERAVKQSRKFSFASAGVPIGANLALTKDESINCVVNSDSTVIFQDKEMSVSGSALLALQQLGYKWSAVAGTEYWLYAGETLLSLRSAREAQNS